jgi:hypothetical protein
LLELGEEFEMVLETRFTLKSLSFYQVSHELDVRFPLVGGSPCVPGTSTRALSAACEARVLKHLDLLDK